MRIRAAIHLRYESIVWLRPMWASGDCYDNGFLDGCSSVNSESLAHIGVMALSPHMCVVVVFHDSQRWCLYQFRPVPTKLVAKRPLPKEGIQLIFTQ